MKSINTFCGLAMAVVLQLGVLAGSAQTNIYVFSGSETNITLNPGIYIITVPQSRVLKLQRRFVLRFLPTRALLRLGE